MNSEKRKVTLYCISSAESLTLCTFGIVMYVIHSVICTTKLSITLSTVAHLY